ncbi:hypothetical protein FHP25_24865 [Vineibacter terrae]|uniref:Uncharacterized protein n=1 Tax=Vineibacter terrae TaxID=2586908 RepID=A0A5C8PGQ1_9HYPH|nr:hypothetical protein [Vineibacter terrae]TXL72530.1 hypothetical protein FHP25_24865 [Vineibacter terrae]
MTEWQADVQIPDALWYAGWHEQPTARTLQVGGRRVEAPHDAAGLARLMALVMTECAAADGACTEAHIAAAGFTADEIALYADRARELARRRTASRDGVGRAHRVTKLKPLRPVFRIQARQESRA